MCRAKFLYGVIFLLLKKCFYHSLKYKTTDNEIIWFGVKESLCTSGYVISIDLSSNLMILSSVVLNLPMSLSKASFISVVFGL